MYICATALQGKYLGFYNDGPTPGAGKFCGSIAEVRAYPWAPFGTDYWANTHTYNPSDEVNLIWALSFNIPSTLNGTKSPWSDDKSFFCS